MGKMIIVEDLQQKINNTWL